jgi:hypothetical protein
MKLSKSGSGCEIDGRDEPPRTPRTPREGVAEELKNVIPIGAEGD